MKSYEIHLPYFKQGDDLCCCLEDSKDNVVEALEKHAEMLNDAARQLICIKNVIEETKTNDKVYINAGTHVIEIDGPESLLKELLKNELIEVMEFDDGDDEDDEDDDDDEDEDDLLRMCNG
jgi:hypothetical protein